MEREYEHKTPPLARGLLTTDSCWERETVDILKSLAPDRLTTLQQKSHIQAYMSNTNIT